MGSEAAPAGPLSLSPAPPALPCPALAGQQKPGGRGQSQASSGCTGLGAGSGSMWAGQRRHCPMLAEAMRGPPPPHVQPLQTTRDGGKILQAFPMKSFPQAATPSASWLRLPPAASSPLARGLETQRLGARQARPERAHSCHPDRRLPGSPTRAGTKHLYPTPGNGAGPGTHAARWGTQLQQQQEPPGGCLDSPSPAICQVSGGSGLARAAGAARLKKRTVVPQRCGGLSPTL